jgi:hypothetical protein
MKGFLVVAKNTTPFDVESMRLFSSLLDAMTYLSKQSIDTSYGLPRGWHIYEFQINSNKKTKLINAAKVKSRMQRIKSGESIKTVIS